MVEKQKIILPEVFATQLINTHETGMGYHKVDVYFKNGMVIRNQIVLNCSILTLDKSIILSVEEIDKIEIV